MITRTETDKEGKPVRVYHRAGTLTVDGVRRVDEKFAWTHPEKERGKCVACSDGRIPPGLVKEDKDGS